VQSSSLDVPDLPYEVVPGLTIAKKSWRLLFASVCGVTLYGMVCLLY
jgi:hypothetical protein